jgi:HK97 family phage major capsid protein
METELSQALDGLLKNFEQFKARNEARVAELEREVEQQVLRANRPGAGGSDRSNGNLAAERKALGRLVKAGDDSEIKSVAGMSFDTDPGGGYVVLPHMAQTMIKRIWDQSPIRRLARVQTIESGSGWEEPLDDDQAEAEWVGERQARPVLDAPELGLLRVPLNEIYSNVKVTQKLLDLSFVNVGQWVEGKLADRFARSEGEAYVSGDGVGKPQGFLTLATSIDGDFTRPRNTLQHVMSGGATAILPDALKDLYWSLRSAHRATATWLMASATANAIDKLKFQDTGEYIWRDSSTAGAPPTLLGRPVEFDENMPAIGAGAYPIAFADFSAAYLIVDWQAMKFLRDPYTDKPNVLFYCYRRTGGGVALTDALKLLKIGT